MSRTARGRSQQAADTTIKSSDYQAGCTGASASPWQAERPVRHIGTNLVRCRYRGNSKEYSMGNNKNPNEKQPGEKEPGTFHYNPGNMSGKTIGKEESK